MHENPECPDLVSHLLSFKATVTGSVTQGLLSAHHMSPLLAGPLLGSDNKTPSEETTRPQGLCIPPICFLFASCAWQCHHQQQLSLESTYIQFATLSHPPGPSDAQTSAPGEPFPKQVLVIPTSLSFYTKNWQITASSHVCLCNSYCHHSILSHVTTILCTWLIILNIEVYSK